MRRESALKESALQALQESVGRDASVWQESAGPAHRLRRVLRIVSSAVVGAVCGVLLFGLAFSGTGYAAPAIAGARHTVQPGDTFYLIAQRYGLATDQLMSANGYQGYDLLYPGQVLTIPAGAHYTVAAGDTAYLIALYHGTTVDNLLSLNNLTPDSNGDVAIYPGQVLLLTGESGGYQGGVAEASDTGFQQYTVRPGDTLDLIAQQYGASVDAIYSSNNLQDDMIYPGQVLLLPGGTSPAGTSGAGASRANLTDADTYLLAQLINAEAAAEPYEGQVAVGAVVLNRLLDPDFPKTIRDVVFQYEGGAYQFEPVINGTIYGQPSASALRAAYAALAGWDPTSGALFFYNPQKSGSSFFNTWLTFLRQIGNHLFYK